MLMGYYTKHTQSLPKKIKCVILLTLEINHGDLKILKEYAIFFFITYQKTGNS